MSITKKNQYRTPIKTRIVILWSICTCLLVFVVASIGGSDEQKNQKEQDGKESGTKVNEQSFDHSNKSTVLTKALEIIEERKKKFGAARDNEGQRAAALRSAFVLESSVASTAKAIENTDLGTAGAHLRFFGGGSGG